MRDDLFMIIDHWVFYLIFELRDNIQQSDWKNGDALRTLPATKREI